MDCPPEYAKLNELFSYYRANARSVLQLNCHNGDYVIFLKSKGYIAKGLEPNSVWSRFWLHYPCRIGDLDNITSLFEGETFDAIVAQETFNVKSMTLDIAHHRPFRKRKFKADDRYMVEPPGKLLRQVRPILEAVYSGLNKRGHAIFLENDPETGGFAFGKGDAQELGFQCRKFDLETAVLVK